ncbi:MAG: DUF3108 domain-containing protein [Betaproteobacteria bacterium]|jgi:hypothetical protein|nr:DUF3108 domain-containing protein [Betaproteobacteria bacterium]
MELTVASFALAPRRRWWEVRPALLVALALSSAVHFAISLLPDELPTAPDPTPLSASIRELPPPPTPKAVPAPVKPRPRRPAPPAPAPSPVETPAEETVAEAPQAEASKTAATEPAPPAEAPATAAPPEPAVLAEEVSAPAEAAPAKVLPPRVDLSYKVLYGAGFHVGTLTYRFEHADNRYTISTIGEARGLAALFVRGQGRVQSRGVITGQGLQPTTLEVDRFNKRGSERAEFDWETGIATLHEDKVAPLELPTFDPLTMMWQFYFQPPEGATQTFALATTRRVNRVTVRRERTETIEWNGEKLDTEVWHRTSEDGKTEAYVWLAPGLRWIPVKVRAEHATRGAVEAVLDAIRVDEPLAQAPEK